jgi:hypothetical protein
MMLAAALLVVAATGRAVQAEDWDMYLTVDNEFDIYFGTSTTTTAAPGGGNNWNSEYHYTAAGRLSTDYLYVATASDHSSAQGFIGTFTNTTTNATISTGNAVWEVFAAGAYAATNPYGAGNWPASTMPSQTEVNTAIAFAEANGLWVTPSSASGYDNDLSTPITGYTWEWGSTYANIEPSASWIWYDSGNDPYVGNFAPVPLIGFNHDEFLVFRVAGAAPEPATLGLLALGLVPALLRRRRWKMSIRDSDVTETNKRR